MIRGFWDEKKSKSVEVFTSLSFLSWMIIGELYDSVYFEKFEFILMDFNLFFGVLSYALLFHLISRSVLDFDKDLIRRPVVFLYASVAFLFFIIVFRGLSFSLFNLSSEEGSTFTYWITLIFVASILFASLLLGLKKYSMIRRGDDEKGYVQSQIEYLFVSLAISMLGILMMMGVFFVLDVRLDQLVSMVGGLSFAVILYSIVRYQIKSPFILFSSPRHIRTKIIIPILALAISVMAFLGVVTYVFLKASIEQDMVDKFNIAIQSKVERIEEFISKQKEVVEIIASDHHFSDFLLVHYDEDVAEVTEVHEDIGGHRQEVLDSFRSGYMDKIFILDQDGKIVMSTDRNIIGDDRSEADYYSGGMKETGVGKMVLILEKTKGVIPIYAPIRQGSSQRAIGVMVIMIEKDGLDEILTDTVGLGETGETYLVNNDYRRITPSRFLASLLEGEFIEERNVRECFLHRDDVVQEVVRADNELLKGKGYLGEDSFLAHAYMPELDWCVLANISQEEALRPLGNLSRFLYISGFAVIAISYLMIIWVSRKITKPIVNLRKGVELIEKGEREYRVGTDARDEIGDLSRAFDKMTLTISESESEIDKKVMSQTADISEKKKKIEEQQMATLNILEDVERERDKAESLAGDLEKFRLAVENTSDHIAIANPDGIVVYVNKSMKKDLGFSDKEIASGKIGAEVLWKGLMDDEFYQSVWETIREEKKVFSGEMKNKKASGAEYESMISISPILNKEGKILFFVSIERDITREKEVDKAKTEFVSLASHQLRTPLSAVNWYAEMLLSGDAGKITKKQKQYIDEIYTGNQRMVELVNALLNVSRIELGTFSIDPRSTNIVEIFNDAISELKQQIKDKSIKVKTIFDKSLPEISLDHNLMNIVFQNLLSNAVKYTPEKGKVEVEISNDKRDMLIRISDNGYGIPREQHDRIFEKLFRADNVREKETDGTGLGLYIVKSIIDQSGGRVWFESEEGKGTDFYVSIPLSGMKKKAGQKGLSPA
jgi:PAS domain S-box-containing protein